MSSIREQALVAIKAALGSTGTPAAHVFRSQLDQIRQNQLPCYDISPDEEKPGGEFGDKESVSRNLIVVVRSLIDGGAAMGEDADPTVMVDDSPLDPFYIFAITKLTGNGANLGGLVSDVREIGSSAVFRPEGRDIIGLEQQFEVIFATKRGDPTQKG